MRKNYMIILLLIQAMVLQAYDITSTSFVHDFAGQTLNTSDFTWSTEPDYLPITLVQDDSLIISETGTSWEKINLNFTDSLDISENPYIEIIAKSTVDSTYKLQILDTQGGSSYSQFSIDFIGDGELHTYLVDVSKSWADLTRINQIRFLYDDQETNRGEIVIKKLSMGVEPTSIEIDSEESPSLPTDRPRVIVGDKYGYGYSVLTSDRNLLRGGAIWLWRAKFLNDPSQFEYAFQDDYYQTLSDSGVNFIRLCVYTQSNDWGGGTNYNDQEEVDFLLKHTDSVVNFASKYGMYVLLNYHDVGKYTGEYGDKDAPTMGYLKDFWDIFAPRYKNRTHVFYEPVNEPAFGSSNFKGAMLDSMYYMYDYIKDMAPETHQSLLCITGAVSKSWDSESMVDAVGRFTATYQDSVDWTNASIAFHPYVTTEKDYPSDPIKDVMKDYAVLNTEANFPCDETIKSQVLDPDKQCQTVDGELFITETMEKLGVSWNFHKVNGWDRFNQNFSLVLKDAREKGYIWFGEEMQTFYFSLHAENGSIIPDVDSITKIPGSTMNFEAIAAEGYEFLNWSGDATSSSQQIVITLNEQNIDLTANFGIEPTEYNLTTTAVPTDGGSVSPSGSTVYDEGTEVTIIALPADGYQFDGWTGIDETKDTVTVIMEADLNVSANFSIVNSIHHYSSQGKIELFPNPLDVGKSLKIGLEGFENETNATISIMDISGRVAYSTNIQMQDLASQRVSIPLGGISAGMYMVIVRSNKKMINQRLIVR